MQLYFYTQKFRLGFLCKGFAVKAVKQVTLNSVFKKKCCHFYKMKLNIFIGFEHIHIIIILYVVFHQIDKKKINHFMAKVIYYVIKTIHKLK